TLQRGFVEKIFHSRAYSVRLIRNCRLFIWRKMYDNVRAVIFNIIGDDKCGYIFNKKVDCDYALPHKIEQKMAMLITIHFLFNIIGDDKCRYIFKKKVNTDYHFY